MYEPWIPFFWSLAADSRTDWPSGIVTLITGAARGGVVSASIAEP